MQQFFSTDLVRFTRATRSLRFERLTTDLNGNVHQRHEHKGAPHLRHQRLTILHLGLAIIAALEVLEEALVSDCRLERKHRPEHAVTVASYNESVGVREETGLEQFKQ